MASRSDAVVLAAAGNTDLASLLAAPPGEGGQTLILSGLDRQEYPGAALHSGTLSGNGATLGFSPAQGDAEALALAFTWDAAAGQWWNPQFGYLGQITYTAPAPDSANAPDHASLSLYTISTALAAQSPSLDPYSLACDPAQFAYAGSAGIDTLGLATLPATTTQAAPTQATPGSLAQAALGFVGQDWSDTGCWTLASIIADQAGAALPVTTSLIGVPAQANGEWQVVAGGSQPAPADWEILLRPGDVISFLTADGTGHVATVTSGMGWGTVILDNAAFVDAAGTIVNAASDGTAGDIVVAAPHPAYQELVGTNPSDVAIYRLDTPTVLLPEGGTTLNDVTAGLPLAPMFLAETALPGESITAWQVYDTAADGSLSLGGASLSAHDAASALTLATLSGLVLHDQPGRDVVEARASNGTSWSDWTPLGVTTLVPVTQGSTA